ncbi:unnamed protein product [Adineta steineri]|uniref:ADP ribosyltransferase domain-containing protein n=1 Tax=Adineta steineri TaxID=433720 RepID=A0A819YC23_9BILA|nr:unnamed protein product [Adineta steineri]CAF4153810.1 unnamed protein product [Adineta steineri]
MSNENTVTRRRDTSRKVKNILLIWLDNNIDESNEDCQNTILQLRHAVNDINIFTNDDECIEFIASIYDNKTCIVMPGYLGQRIIPRIHEMPQVDSIFIFCGDRERHQQWAKDWCKVKAVFKDIGSICQALKQIAQQLEQNAIPISFVASGKRVDQLEPSFMYTQILKELLLTIHFNESHRHDFISYCHSIFSNNIEDIEDIDKLEKDYHQKTPIWWYTLDCFLYRMLNRALRTMDGDIITRLGFFIKDLHLHIEQLYHEQFVRKSPENNILTLFRGQSLSEFDFQQLKQSKDGLISFNSFLSTSNNRNAAFEFAEKVARNADQVGILYVMKINPAQSTTPFASVADISDYQAEDEVLFSMHSVFRINDIKSIEGNNRLYEVYLTLTNDNDPELFKLSHHIRKESYPDKNPSYRLGALLLKMGQPSRAEDIYQILLKETKTDIEKISIYYQLGLVKNNQGKYEEAIKLYEKSLIIQQKTSASNTVDVANLHNWMGNAYFSMGDYSKALPIYHEALSIRQQSLPKDDPDLAKSYINIGNVHHSVGNYENALSSYEKALTIQRQSLPLNHPDLASTYVNIGLAYDNMNDYENALTAYETALPIQKQSLPPNHPDLAKSYNNIGLVHAKLGDYDNALSSYEKALTIKKQSLPSNHLTLAFTYMNIGNVLQNIGNYENALSSYEKALVIRQQSLPSNHVDLAKSYNNMGVTCEKMENYSKAGSFYQRAIEVGEQSLPSNHPVLQSMRNNFERVKNE